VSPEVVRESMSAGSSNHQRQQGASHLVYPQNDTRLRGSQCVPCSDVRSLWRVFTLETHAARDYFSAELETVRRPILAPR
jgi:hypothetical protein